MNWIPIETQLEYSLSHSYVLGARSCLKTTLSLTITTVLVSLSNAVPVRNDTLEKNLYEGIQEMNILRKAKTSLKLGDRDTPAPFVGWFSSKAICSDYT